MGGDARAAGHQLGHAAQLFIGRYAVFQRQQIGRAVQHIAGLRQQKIHGRAGARMRFALGRGGGQLGQHKQRQQHALAGALTRQKRKKLQSLLPFHAANQRGLAQKIRACVQRRFGHIRKHGGGKHQPRGAKRLIPAQRLGQKRLPILQPLADARRNDGIWIHRLPSLMTASKLKTKLDTHQDTRKRGAIYRRKWQTFAQINEKEGKSPLEKIMRSANSPAFSATPSARPHRPGRRPECAPPGPAIRGAGRIASAGLPCAAL